MEQPAYERVGRLIVDVDLDDVDVYAIMRAIDSETDLVTSRTTNMRIDVLRETEP